MHRNLMHNRRDEDVAASIMGSSPTLRAIAQPGESGLANQQAKIKALDEKAKGLRKQMSALPDGDVIAANRLLKERLQVLNDLEAALLA
jgi:hypothetical protein